MDWREERSCPRCGGSLRASIMSRFNEQTICIPCSEDERQAPGYRAAAAAEEAACRAGNYNFPGVGLSAADRAFLRDRLAARR